MVGAPPKWPLGFDERLNSTLFAPDLISAVRPEVAGLL